MPTVKIINDKTKWNNFLLNQPTQTGIFLQSEEWLAFQEKLGRKIYRLGLVDEQNNLSALCGAIVNPLPLGKKYLYCPRGPVMNYELGIRNYEFLIEEILKIAKKENSIFFRAEPSAPNYSLPVIRCPLLQVAPIQPQQTLVLNLEKDENELLAAMHEKTRYNVRLAEKKNLILKNGVLGDFWKLMEETTTRDKFRPHSKKYYESILENINGDGKNKMRVELKIVYLDGAPLAAAIVGYFGDTATYLHGASSNENRNLMAPYFLHWEIIKKAKTLGYKYYDFWGIDETKWPGVTRFKKGFASEASPDRSPDALIGTSVGSGHIVNYPGTFDLPINKLWYKIYNLARKIL